MPDTDQHLAAPLRFDRSLSAKPLPTRAPSDHSGPGHPNRKVAASAGWREATLEEHFTHWREFFRVPDDDTPGEVNDDLAKIHEAAVRAKDDPGRALAVAHAHLRSHSPVVVLGAMCLASEALCSMRRFGRLDGLGVDRYDDALAAGDAAVALDDRSAQAHWRKAVALYRLGRFHEAAGEALRVTELAPGYAKAWELRGQIALWNSPENAADADKFFQRAYKLDPQGCPLPFRVSPATFKAIVGNESEQFSCQLREHNSQLDPEFQTRVYNPQIEVRELPSPRDVMTWHDPDILGAWGRSKAGVSDDPLTFLPTERSDPYFATFAFFQRNCENICSDEASMRKAIHATMFAELNGALQLNTRLISLKHEQPDDDVGPVGAP